MPDLTDLVGEKTGDRYKCPVCSARRGISLEPDSGDTGVAHCFSCGRGWTGAQLYAEVHHVEINEALSAFGIEADPDEVDEARSRHQKRKQEREDEEEGEDPLLKTEYAKRLMTETERRVFSTLLQSEAKQYTVFQDVDPEDVCNCNSVTWRESGTPEDEAGAHLVEDDKNTFIQVSKTVMRVEVPEETTEAMRKLRDKYIERALSRSGPSISELNTRFSGNPYA